MLTITMTVIINHINNTFGVYSRENFRKTERKKMANLRKNKWLTE